MIYAAGVVAGVQIALYLFDLLDNGVADWRSGLIAVLFLAAGIGWIVRSLRQRA